MQQQQLPSLSLLSRSLSLSLASPFSLSLSSLALSLSLSRELQPGVKKFQLPLVCHPSELYLSSGAANLCFHRDQYTIAQSYAITNSNIDAKRTALLPTNVTVCRTQTR